MKKYTRQSKIKETCNERKHTVSLFCAWNITTVEINSGIHLLKNEIHQLPLFTSGGLGLKNLVLFTSLNIIRLVPARGQMSCDMAHATEAVIDLTR